MKRSSVEPNPTWEAFDREGHRHAWVTADGQPLQPELPPPTDDGDDFGSISEMGDVAAGLKRRPQALTVRTVKRAQNGSHLCAQCDDVVRPGFRSARSRARSYVADLP